MVNDISDIYYNDSYLKKVYIYDNSEEIYDFDSVRLDMEYLFK